MERVLTHKTISLSKWYVKVKERNSWTDRTCEILIVGDNMLKISKDPRFLSRVYQALYKKKWRDQMKKQELKVIKIELLKNLGESFSKEYDVEKETIQ
jgi:hypothetical protein